MYDIKTPVLGLKRNLKKSTRVDLTAETEEAEIPRLATAWNCGKRGSH